MRDRLIELLQDNSYLDVLNEEHWLEAAEQLLSNGVIVLPCKVGDTVYWLDDGNIKNGEVFEISIHSDGIMLHTGTRFCLKEEEIFLACEQAEKALAERKKG